MGNEKNQLKLIKKHAAAIHCVNSLSLLQRKISNAFLYHAYHELLEKEEHVIAISELCSIIGYNSNNYTVIKDSIKGLITTLLEWNLVDDDTGAEDWTATTMLASVNIKGRYCTYSFSPRLKKLFYNPSIYGKINLITQARFKSSYGLALYENCARYRGLPNTKWFPLDLFRKLMGVSDKLYPIFRDFKRRVIDKAVEEVNIHSDIFIDPIVEKVGQRVVRIKFNLKERPKKEKLGSTVEISAPSSSDVFLTQAQIDLLNKLVENFGIPRAKAIALLEKYDEAYITQKINFVMAAKTFQRGEIANVSGYLIKALKEDYLQSPSYRDTLNKQYRQLEEQILNQQQENQKEAARLEEYQKNIQQEFFLQYENLDKEVQEQILNSWWKKVEGQGMMTLFKRYFAKYGVKHPVIYTHLREHAQENYQDFFAGSMDMDP